MEKTVTVAEREAYKRAKMLTMPTWEIQMVNAGQCDKAVRRFIAERETTR